MVHKKQQQKSNELCVVYPHFHFVSNLWGTALQIVKIDRFIEVKFNKRMES